MPAERFYFNTEADYELISINFDKVTLSLYFDENHFIVEGCNIHRLPYTAYDDGSLEILPGASTRRFCVLDEDSEFIQKLLRSNIFDIVDTGYHLYEDNNWLL